MRRLVLAPTLFLVACVGARPPLPLMGDVDRARGTTAAQAAELAPQALDEADAERDRARAAYDAGDDVGASLHAERAIAAYQRARMVARAARATTELAHAESDLASAETELHSLEAARTSAERDGEELAKRLAIAREMREPAPSGPADASREAARRQAARALATQARLLCGAGKLLGAPAQGVDDETRKLDALDKKLEGTGRAPIDEAASARTACLALLTQARHAMRTSASSATTATDVLLSELSAAGLAPTRDERGVVVTLRDAFRGRALAPEAETRLEALGRVAAAHADLPIQVVVHDATPQPPGDDRAKAAAAALVKGGAKPDKIEPFMAGTRAPLVDPSDARSRARNARVEIVFVTGS